jgi:hypothetical protein
MYHSEMYQAGLRKTVVLYVQEEKRCHSFRIQVKYLTIVLTKSFQTP